jgi:GNAT superfamily N-acetyltransferase
MWRKSWIHVAERHGAVIGFIIALPKRAPPIFAPGTKTALIDDFCVAPDQDFAVVGAALLGAVRPRLRAAGFGQLVVVNAAGDRQFGAFLEAQGIRPVCQWSLGEN